MEIQLTPVTRGEKQILCRLYQFYEYDFSVYTNQEISKNGSYEADIDYLWEGDARWKPYFIEVFGNIAGFVVVLLENLDTDPDPTHVIYDFMILQKYRRHGIGKAAAVMAFDMYQADWKVVQMENNVPAIAFWRKVIGGYTNNQYTERYRDDLKKYIQEFSTK